MTSSLLTRARLRYPAILLREMVVTDFKIRYQGSLLGYLWSLLKPLAIFSILYLVFVRFLRFGAGIQYFAVYLLLGIVIWGFFIESTTQGMNSIVNRSDLIRKINFPRYVIVLSAALSAFINLIFNMIVVCIFLIVLKVPIRITAVWLPFLFIELMILSISLAFFLSALFVRFRDVGHFWDVMLLGAFYATPIIYPLTLIPTKYSRILILNPVAQLIQDTRFVLVTPQTQTISQLYGSGWARLLPLTATMVLAVTSVAYFKRRARYFAEEA